MRPLQDVRIIAIEQFGAGPYGSMHLADLGAEVIKIEDPRFGGDVSRYVPPFQEGEDSLYFETFNRNKRSLSIDLATPAGRAVFEDLVQVSDVVYSNLRGDVPGMLKITYDDLKHLKASIVCCSLSGFGMTGPRQKQGGYDYILQGLAGWMSLTGEPDGPPAKSGLSVVDFSGGLAAAIATLAGLHAARRDGIGMDCDVSLFETALSMLSYPATWYLSRGLMPERMERSAHPSLVPFQNLPTKDGWIVIACPKEYFFERLVTALGRPELANDERFASFAARRDHRCELIAILDELLSVESTAVWVEKLQAVGVPCGPVYSIDQALADPQTLARDTVVETEHPVLGTVRQVASPVRVGQPPTGHRRAPRRNEDAEYLLRKVLEYDDKTVGELSAAGAFGVQPAEPAVPDPESTIGNI